MISKNHAYLEITIPLISDNYKEKEKSQLWDKSFKASSFTTLNEDNSELKKRWKNKNTLKTINKSTLSLHIAAYENSNEIAGSDLFDNENTEGLKKEKFGSIKKQCLTDSFKSRNPFEFPRQQDEDERNKPEVMQFTDGSLMKLSKFARGEKPKTRRIYLIRNGETCDRIGPAWMAKVFRNPEIYRVIDLNQPVKILDRSPSDLYRNDSPLTQVGSISSQLLGRGMALKSAYVHTVYSSPALRCIQTASSIIGNLNMKKSPKICIEPSLIDPLSFFCQH
uniref:Uncharacterized protein n=1 Tax=Panagrolaimus davidi TaxID=227884 RepID=A0A914P622_9BILA